MRRALLVLPVLVLAAACSGGSDEATPTPSSSLPPIETPTPTPTPTFSPTPSPTPTATATPGVRIPAADGDVDGDGTRDSVRTTAERLTVELSGGGTVTAPIHAESPRSAPVLGYGDIDRDGRSEVFVETAQGASTEFVTPYRYDGKALRELQLEEGPARLGIGGSVTHGEGFRCRSGRLEVLSSDSDDGATYTVHLSTYRLSATQLVLLTTRTQQAKQGDALVEASYRPDCGSVGD